MAWRLNNYLRRHLSGSIVARFGPISLRPFIHLLSLCTTQTHDVREDVAHAILLGQRQVAGVTHLQGDPWLVVFGAGNAVLTIIVLDVVVMVFKVRQREFLLKN